MKKQQELMLRQEEMVQTLKLEFKRLKESQGKGHDLHKAQELQFNKSVSLHEKADQKQVHH